MSIRAYILLLIIAMTLVPSGLIVFTALHQRNDDLHVATQLAEDFTSEVSKKQDILLSSAEQLLACLAFIPSVQNHDASATNVLLAALVKKVPEITNILIAESTGLVWASALPMRNIIWANDRRFFKNAIATGKFSSGEFTIGRIKNIPAISFGYPIKDQSGKILDVAIISFDLTPTNNMLKMKKYPDFMNLVMTDHKGTILFNATNPEYIGKQEKPEIFKRMVEGPVIGTFEAVGITGKDRYFAYRKLYLDKEQTPYMYVRSGILKKTVTRKTWNNLILHVGMMTSFMVLAIGFALYFSKRNLVDKIAALRNATQKIAQGDLNIHVSDSVSGGELDELGDSFDVMAQRLADDIAERKRVEDERQGNLLFIETLLKNAPVGIRVFDGESGKCLLVNQVAADISGGDMEVLQRQNFLELASWQRSGLMEIAKAVLADGCARTAEIDMLTSFGKQISVAYIVSSFMVKDRPHLLVIGRDITAEKQLIDKNRKMEIQMQHVQKLESMGVLAGGIAHDFNNILMAILGNAELALMRLAPETPVRNNLRQIEKAAQRAADLAQQMLAYSGKGSFVIELIDINDLIMEMNHILEISVSKKAFMSLNLARNLPLFEGDGTQISQIIMNLIINASEAIGEASGEISVTTGSVYCEQSYLSRIWPYDKLEEGYYIFFEIADNGCGMDQDTLTKIFDPFFSTKFTGRGLGLAAVLGIVRGHHGAIAISSVPGKGTQFKVLLPAIENTSGQPLPEAAPASPSVGSGTILLVDDEESILTLGREVLEELGYSVLAAENGIVALELFKEHKEEIECVILDMTMPILDGEQTLRELRLIDQGVRVILSSGFNEQDIIRKFVGTRPAGFIKKPYKLLDLSRILRKVIA